MEKMRLNNSLEKERLLEISDFKKGKFVEVTKTAIHKGHSSDINTGSTFRGFLSEDLISKIKIQDGERNEVMSSSEIISTVSKFDVLEVHTSTSIYEIRIVKDPDILATEIINSLSRKHLETEWTKVLDDVPGNEPYRGLSWDERGHIDRDVNQVLMSRNSNLDSQIWRDVFAHGISRSNLEGNTASLINILQGSPLEGDTGPLIPIEDYPWMPAYTGFDTDYVLLPYATEPLNKNYGDPAIVAAVLVNGRGIPLIPYLQRMFPAVNFIDGRNLSNTTHDLLQRPSSEIKNV